MLRGLRALIGVDHNKALRPNRTARLARSSSRVAFGSKPRSKRMPQPTDYQFQCPTGIDAHEARVRLYRFLRDNLPALDAAVWTWVRMAAAPLQYSIHDRSGQAVASREADAAIESLSHRVYDNKPQRFGGIDALLVEFFNSLFTTGSVCGELLVDPTGTGVERFYFVDPATIRFNLNRSGDWEMFQQVENRKIDLAAPSTYFYGLDGSSVEPWGRSLLSSVPFAARIEQALVSDMNRSMHNAGYHRIHVRIRPPERLAGETDDTYVSRANEYFDETVRMLRDIEPDDNPITWDDVEIAYIGPASKISSSSSWYINHKSMIEDICAGTHLAPFMIGYSYGSTQTWAEFNFELLQRQLRTIQSAASKFLEWITRIELALRGIDLDCKWRFENAVNVGLLDRRRAEGLHVDNVLKKLDAGLIDGDAAKRELGIVG